MPVSAFQRAAQQQKQESQVVPMSGPDAPAFQRGWATPPELKQDLVDEMVKIVTDPDMKTKDRVAAFNALRVADQSQWERDHPVESGKSKGGVSNTTNNNVIIAAAAAVRSAIERGELGIVEGVPALNQSNTPSNS